MSDHITGTSAERLALSGSAAHRRADPAQNKFLTWYMSQRLADVNRALLGYYKHCNQQHAATRSTRPEYLTANPTALRQEDPR